MSHDPGIELIHDPDCPNVEKARAAIRRALADLGISVAWQEWERGSPETPPLLRNLGSPTVLVDGRDVGNESGDIAPADANSCRVYRENGRITGAPSAATIAKAIARARQERSTND